MNSFNNSETQRCLVVLDCLQALFAGRPRGETGDPCRVLRELRDSVGSQDWPPELKRRLVKVPSACRFLRSRATTPIELEAVTELEGLCRELTEAWDPPLTLELRDDSLVPVETSRAKDLDLPASLLKVTRCLVPEAHSRLSDMVSGSLFSYYSLVDSAFAELQSWGPQDAFSDPEWSFVTERALSVAPGEEGLRLVKVGNAWLLLEAIDLRSHPEVLKKPSWESDDWIVMPLDARWVAACIPQYDDYAVLQWGRLRGPWKHSIRLLSGGHYLESHNRGTPIAST